MRGCGRGNTNWKRERRQNEVYFVLLVSSIDDDESALRLFTMPFRFNQRELIAFASKDKNEFDKEGILFLKEVEEKIFLRTERFSERLFRLKGNLLFYFKTKYPSSEVVGLIVLDQSNITTTTTSRKYSFTIDSKHCDDFKYELAAESQEELKDWITKINNARYEAISMRLLQLRTDIIKLSGEDPLLQYPSVESQQPCEEQPSISEILLPTKTNCNSAVPITEMCIACSNLVILQDQSKPVLMVKVFVMQLPEKSWSKHWETEFCEDSKEPFFLKTVVFDSKFMSSTQLKFILYDVRSKSRGISASLGQAVCSIEDVKKAPGCRLSLNLRNLESKEEIGDIIIQGWMRKAENSFSRRQDSIDFITGYGSRDYRSLINFPRTYVVEVCERSFHFPTKNGGDIKFQELMGESIITFKLASQILNLYINEEKEAVLELYKLGELERQLEPIRYKQQNGHFNLVSLYSESLSELSNYKGRNYKRSTERCCKELEFVTTNLHVQRLRVIEQNDQDHCYDIITFGCPAAHSLRFRHGGLHRLLSSVGDLSYKDSGCVTENGIMMAGSKAKNVKCVLSETKTEISALCDKIENNLDKESLKITADALSNKVADLINLASSNFVQDSEAELAMARASVDTSGNQNETSVQTDWRWDGEEYKVVDPSDTSLNDDNDCGLRDELAKFMSLVNLATQDTTFLEQNALGKSAKKLFDVVKSFVKKLNVIMGFILMKRNNHIGSNTKELRYRRDIVFSQVLAPVVAGFNVKLSENLRNKVFMEQISKIGVLVTFESLITPYGDELGMMEDALVAYSDLANVSFRLVCNNAPQSFPSLSGNRENIVVSVPLHKENFQQLPMNLQKGGNIPIHSVLFNVGINEHATIAERFGDMSIQETINSENLNKLYNYYDKFTTYFPNWVGTSSKQQISLPMLMWHLKTIVNSKKSKNVEIFSLFEEISQRMNAIRLTTCKSAKDRTAMAVTLEAARILQREHNLPSELFVKTLNTMRSEGTRLINSFKNVGIPKYAFNMVQVRAYPSLYRPPEGTYGKNIQN